MTGVPAGLGVEPTPDDGTRRSDERPWDDATRPSGPPVDRDRTYTPHERAVGQHLVDVHDGLRGELEQLRESDRAGRGGHPRRRRRPLAHRHDALRQNNWTLGTYCESYCRIVTTHHTIEDQSMLPHLRARDPRLAPVVDRLQEEHLVIHDLLDRVDRALVDLVAGKPDGLDEAQRRGRPACRRPALAPVLRGARARGAVGPPRFRLTCRVTPQGDPQRICWRKSQGSAVDHAWIRTILRNACG